MVQAVNGLKDYLLIWVPDGTGGEKRIRVPQIKTTPDIGGTPNQIDATTKESQIYTESIAGLMSLGALSIGIVPQPRKDGVATDAISIMNMLEPNESYRFEIGMPQLGWKFAGYGMFSLAINSNTNDDLKEGALNIIAQSLSKPIPLTAFEISYDTNGNAGVAPVDPMPYEAGDLATILPGTGITDGTDPFKEWNTKRDGTGTAYQAGQVTTMTASLRLFAQLGT